MSFKKLSKRSLTSEMERNVKQMLKLIGEDGDSFAQKAEMYYQKRPEMISLVEEFSRGYKLLAERCDYSDNGSEPNSTWPSPSSRMAGRRISSSRAAGFDFFLGSSFNGNVGNNMNGYYEASNKDGDGSSTLTDSDDESDASSVNSFNSVFFGGGGNSRRIMELEMELREVKEKLCMYENDHGGLLNNKRTRMIEDGNNNDNGEDLREKVNAYEQQLRNVNEKLMLSEVEIAKLKVEIEKYRSLESANLHDAVEYLSCDEHNDNESIGEELRITKLKLKTLEMQIASLRFEESKSLETNQQLQDQLSLAMKEIASWKTKFYNNVKRLESTKNQERPLRLRTNLADKDNEIRDLKTALTNAEQSISFEKAQLKSEISRLVDAQTQLEEKIKKVQSEKKEIEEALKGEIEVLKEDIEVKNNNVKGLNASLNAMNLQVEEIKLRAKELEEENERQKCEILESAEEKREAIRQLCFSLEHYRNGYNKLREAFIGHKRFPVLAA